MIRRSVFKMQIQILLQVILFCTIVRSQGALTASGRQDGNIWDMLLAQDLSNDDITFEAAPSYNIPLEVYGPPQTPTNPPNSSPASGGGIMTMGSISVPSRPVPIPTNSVSNIGFSAGGTITPSGIIQPQLEILKLVENFLKLKGEIGSRLYAVIIDNWDLIRAVYNTAINNVGTLHAFTVNGIIILRKILQFALQLFGNWQITVPNVSLDFSTLIRESDFNSI